MPRVGALLAAQDGVVSRAQLVATGLRDHDLRRMVRRRELTRLHAGVYVHHAGPPTWRQKAWAAVLVAAPAVLSHGSALQALGLEQQHDLPVHVAVDRRRTVVAPGGVRVHFRTGLGDHALWHLSPPRTRVEDAVLDVAACRGRADEVLATMADAVQGGRTRCPAARARWSARPVRPAHAVGRSSAPGAGPGPSAR